MNDEINYKNNPLHGVSLKNVLIELVDHYGFELLFAYLNINCFKTNASIDSSIKFLKKTDWAREKVEVFYLYEFKNLPRASSEQFLLPPRDRVVPESQKPGEPAELSFEHAELLNEKRIKKAAARGQKDGHRPSKSSGPQRGKYSSGDDNHRTRASVPESSQRQSTSEKSDDDPWGKWKNKSKR
ncbi:MAG: hypothetical protein ACI92E_001485 [Oceanicoccus sp.]|jgi:uncharacterized protein (DUF2132 family)